MPFGLKNAPATFQRMIDPVLLPAREYCRAFMDDGTILSFRSSVQIEDIEIFYLFYLLSLYHLRTLLPAYTSSPLLHTTTVYNLCPTAQVNSWRRRRG